MSRSRHTQGDAADIIPRGIGLYDALMLAQQVHEFNVGGIGLNISPAGKGSIHVDVRPGGRARWAYLLTANGRQEIPFFSAVGILQGAKDGAQLVSNA